MWSWWAEENPICPAHDAANGRGQSDEGIALQERVEGLADRNRTLTRERSDPTQEGRD